jgi:hypothetical protein
MVRQANDGVGGPEHLWVGSGRASNMDVVQRPGIDRPTKAEVRIQSVDIPGDIERFVGPTKFAEAVGVSPTGPSVTIRPQPGVLGGCFLETTALSQFVSLRSGFLLLH